jgi:hypothetical protein
MPRFNAFPPAGYRVRVMPFFSAWDRSRFPVPEDAAAAIPFRSGSESLYQLLKSLRETSERHSKGIVAVPAYCCPRVLGAALGAGWKPEFVDLEPESLSMDAVALERALERRASVVITVDLFGVPTQSERLKFVGGDSQAFLIRDMAQCALEDISRLPMGADAGILSFGRGKPTSVLSGGAVVVGRTAATLVPIILGSTPAVHFSALAGAIRAFVYDLAIRPTLYGLVRHLPGLHVGESSLVVTRTARRLSPEFLGLVADQSAGGAAFRLSQRAASIAMMGLLQESNLTVLRAAADAVSSFSLSRIPALAPNAQRANQLRVQAARLGVTAMYGKTLAEFHGCGARAAAQNWPNAFALSRRLLTFPANGGLPPKAEVALASCLR